MDKYGNGHNGTAEPTLHRRIADDLRRQIRAGELRAGDSVPSEHALQASFAVSRGTVRQALAALRTEGLISGTRGSPPRVNGLTLTQPLDQLVSFSAWIESLGQRATGRVVEFGPRLASPVEAEALGCRPGEPVFHLIRVRYADDEPLLVERTTFPERIGAMLLEVDLRSHSIYAELTKRGMVVVAARQVIGAMAAGKEDARLLGVALRAPLLRARRRGYDAAGHPLEIADDRYLADRVNFTIEHGVAASGVARRLS
ncbi:MAG TPA: GntR family transcriptional regulator [Chloroflexota bacterium]|nr:GntR family transcriptional regulator [Chloroflexota bacterium]